MCIENILASVLFIGGIAGALVVIAVSLLHRKHYKDEGEE